MTKKSTIIVSLIMILSAIIIVILINYSKIQINEHYGFFAGFLGVTGLSLLIKLFFGKKDKD